MAVFVLARLDNEVLRGLTECIVVASTRIGANPFYGEAFNLVVSSELSLQQIRFVFTNINN
jgi:hypothetical protein